MENYSTTRKKKTLPFATTYISTEAAKWSMAYKLGVSVGWGGISLSLVVEETA